VSLYFSLRQVSLTEYLLLLRALFPLLLQMVRCTMDIASTVSILLWETTRPWAWPLHISYPLAFVGLDRELALYLNQVCVGVDLN
jgi:hypothetical protein